MGEMADFVNDHAGIPYQDAYEREDEYKVGTACRYCGEMELHWEQKPLGRKDRIGWRLFDSRGLVHSCEEGSHR